MMSRVTNALIEAMQSNAVDKAGITNALAELVKRDNALTEAMRVQAMGGKENLDRLKKLEARYQLLVKEAGKDFETGGVRRLVNQDFYLNANLAGASIRRAFQSDKGHSEKRVAPAERVVFQQGDPLIDEFYAIRDERKALEERRDTVRASVRAAVNKVTTVKKLLELWPEAAELLPAAEQKAASVPAIATKDLNALIGLPSGK